VRFGVGGHWLIIMGSLGYVVRPAMKLLDTTFMETHTIQKPIPFSCSNMVLIVQRKEQIEIILKQALELLKQMDQSYDRMEKTLTAMQTACRKFNRRLS